MSLLGGLRNVLVEALRPGTRQESGELAALREMYDHRNTGNPRPNQWYRVHSQAGLCVGYSYTCNCHQEFQLLSHLEYARDYECSLCHGKFNLFKDHKICDAEGNFKVRLPDIDKILLKLPIRPRLAGKPSAPPFIMVGDEDYKIQWDGPTPAVPDGWK